MITEVYEVYFFRQKETVYDYLTEDIHKGLYSTKEKAVNKALELMRLRNKRIKNKIFRVSDYKYSSTEKENTSYDDFDYYIVIKKIKVY